MAEVVTQEVGAVGVVAVEPVRLAEGVVQGRVEGAGAHEGGQRRDRLAQLPLPAHLLRGQQVLGLQLPGQVDRVAVLCLFLGDAGDALDERLHRREGGVVAQAARREGPHVAQRHRAEPAGRLAAARAHDALDVKERDAVNGRAAELDRRAVGVVLVAVANRLDADVGRLHGRPQEIHESARITTNKDKGDGSGPHPTPQLLSMGSCAFVAMRGSLRGGAEPADLAGAQPYSRLLPLLHEGI